ncbi:response regulator [Sandaracinobacteroides saxicola]|uniref:Response regulator transcription factor n=1 Tax=Sandaracinobacteroides saxicola TaxID=2759707 RepID=A0A7G5ILG0_9SPHN|nr:response regulator transcription factor [Sandaracinobacteroides saxicola]QMW24202.1 response regulator transcription factor [Sandaracinobacteroides saxicola]
MTRILVVDDEPAIRRLLRGALARVGYDVAEAGDAAAALRLGQPPVALAVLDLGLPDRDGIELVPLLKARGLAVVVVTARDTTAEKVAALDLGADDYVTKPFDTEELLARVRTALRHQGRAAAGLVSAGAVTVDLAAHRVTLGGQEVKLTRKEFTLLAELAGHAGKVLTHVHLLRAVWGPAHLGDVEYLRVTMRGLRQKLEKDPARPRLIVNEPGVGYRLSPPLADGAGPD